MFNALATIVAEKPVAPKQVDIAQMRLVSKVLRAGLRHAAAKAAMSTNVTDMTQTVKDFTELRQLRQVVKTFGVSRALMEFVNPRNHVSKIIPTIPSNESLDLIGTGQTDPRTQITLSGIDLILATESQVVSDWVNECADCVGDVCDTTAEQMDGLDDAVDHYIGFFSDCDDLGDTANTTVEALTYAEADSAADALTSAITDMDLSVPDPTDADALDAFKTKLMTLADNLGDCTNLCVDPTNPHRLTMDDEETALMPEEKSMADHGYTCDTIKALLVKTAGLMDAFDDMISRKEEMMGQLRAAATFMGSVDNDVPPAVDDAIDSQDNQGTEAMSGGMVTQADMVHHHVSSHMCCMNACMDAMVKCVTNTMNVCDCGAACKTEMTA